MLNQNTNICFKLKNPILRTWSTSVYLTSSLQEALISLWYRKIHRWLNIFTSDNHWQLIFKNVLSATNFQRMKQFKIKTQNKYLKMLNEFISRWGLTLYWHTSPDDDFYFFRFCDQVIFVSESIYLGSFHVFFRLRARVKNAWLESCRYLKPEHLLSIWRTCHDNFFNLLVFFLNLLVNYFRSALLSRPVN